MEVDDESRKRAQEQSPQEDKRKPPKQAVHQKEDTLTSRSLFPDPEVPDTSSNAPTDEASKVNNVPASTAEKPSEPAPFPTDLTPFTEEMYEYFEGRQYDASAVYTRLPIDFRCMQPWSPDEHFPTAASVDQEITNRIQQLYGDRPVAELTPDELNTFVNHLFAPPDKRHPEFQSKDAIELGCLLIGLAKTDPTTIFEGYWLPPPHQQYLTTRFFVRLWGAVIFLLGRLWLEPGEVEPPQQQDAKSCTTDTTEQPRSVTFCPLPDDDASAPKEHTNDDSSQQSSVASGLSVLSNFDLTSIPPSLTHLGIAIRTSAQKLEKLKNEKITLKRTKQLTSEHRTRLKRSINSCRKRIKDLKKLIEEGKNDDTTVSTVASGSFLNRPMKTRKPIVKKKTHPFSTVVQVQFQPFYQNQQADRDSFFLRGEDDGEDTGGIIGFAEQVFKRDKSAQFEAQDPIKDDDVRAKPWNTNSKTPTSRAMAKPYTGGIWLRQNQGAFV